jgi:hypothetical protein
VTKSVDPVLSAASNDVSERLARRLCAETQGEVLIGAASRGRNATDASTYQIFRRAGTEERARHRHSACHRTRRAAGGPANAQTIGAAREIDKNKHLHAVRELDFDRRTVVVVGGGARSCERGAEATRSLGTPVDVSTSAGNPWRHGRE